MDRRPWRASNNHYVGSPVSSIYDELLGHGEVGQEL